MAAASLPRIRKAISYRTKMSEQFAIGLDQVLETVDVRAKAILHSNIHSDAKVNAVIEEATGQYRRTYSLEKGNSFCILMFDLNIELLAKADFCEPDVTYPDTNQPFRYLLNIVVYDEVTMAYVVVARVLMSNLSAMAYKTVFAEIFRIVKEKYPNFEPLDLMAVADFSEAQKKGYLAAQNALGNRAFQLQLIKGCVVHWKRSYHRVLQKLCRTSLERALFTSIADKIPLARNEDEASALFSVLEGKPHKNFFNPNCPKPEGNGLQGMLELDWK